MRRASARQCDIRIVAPYYSEPDHWVVQVTDEALLRAKSKFDHRVALLIHGWNLNTEEQSASYDKMLLKIAENDRAVADALLTVSWPSDTRYRSALEAVGEVTQLLQDFLCDARNPFSRARELILICHSMGCRVALELARRLLEQESGFKPEIRLFLMAAAVPVHLVEPGGALHPTVKGASHSSVYYSWTDEAFLTRGFSFLQSWAGPGDGFMPEAVGFRGKPQYDVWSRRCSKAGYFHGSYWTSLEVAKDLIGDFHRREIRSLPQRTL